MGAGIPEPNHTMNEIINNLAAINSSHGAHGFAAIGPAIGIGLLGPKAAEATGRNPGAAGPILTLSIILAALIEGIVIFAIFLTKGAV